MKVLFSISLLLLAAAFVRPAGAYQRKVTQSAAPPAPASARRVALIIGNGAYQRGPLKNPVNDSRAIRDALRGLGFQVLYYEDLTGSDMKRAIREFGARIRAGGDVGLFYYAGHGIQVRGQNYLIGVDAVPESEDEVEYEAVDAGLVLAQMGGGGERLNIVILDACRDNPFARSFRSSSEGLAPMLAPSGTLIAYATAPGSVASDGPNSSNGVYTEELLRQLKIPGLSIEEVFKRVRIAVRRRTQNKQTPWEESSLTGDFYFMSGAEAAADIGPAPLPVHQATAAELPATSPSTKVNAAVEGGKTFHTATPAEQPRGSLKDVFGRSPVFGRVSIDQRGKIYEIRDMRKVFFEDDVGEDVRRELENGAGLEIVSDPRQAEIFISYSIEPEMRSESGIAIHTGKDLTTMSVFIRGKKYFAGYKTRLVWKQSEEWLSEAQDPLHPHLPPFLSEDDIKVWDEHCVKIARVFVEALRVVRGK